MSRPDGIRAKSGVNVDRFGRAKWVEAVGALKGLSCDGRPNSIARLVWRDPIIGTARPMKAISQG
jgi:hypothetical protein